MDIVSQSSFRRNLLVGFVIVAALSYHRKILVIVTKMFCSKPKWLPYLTKLKKEMKPMFSFDHTSTDIDKIGLTLPEDAWTRENPRCLIADPHAIDSLSLWGADHSGNVVMLRVARRHDRVAEVWIYLRLESGEEFQAPIQPDLHVCNTDGKSFSVRGFYYEVLEQLRRIRLGFNGQLRKGVKNEWSLEEGESVSVQFNFIWHPMFNYSAYPFDFNPVLMAASLSKEKLTDEFLESWSISSTEWHEQWGQMHGPVTIGQQQYTLMLTGTKTIEHGVLDWRTIEKRLLIKGLDSIATGVTLFAQSDKDGSLIVHHGQIAPPSNMGLFSVSECIVDKASRFFDDTDGEVDEEINIDLVASTRKYNIKLKTTGPGFQFYAGENRDVLGQCRMTELTINGKKGFAYIETYEKRSDGSHVARSRSTTQLKEPEYNATEKLVVPFTEDVCQSSKVVGGKGASLALMTSLVSKDNEFQVPLGVCLTKTSFERHLTENPVIAKSIEDLQDVAWTRKVGTLTKECTRVGDLICNSFMSENLQDELKANLVQVFGKAFVGVKFAVRSSAIGEDSEEMSAAGQNETFLGIKGLKKICDAILKCWASQFSFRSVEYKRQNGQLMNGGMGVVIQEMVPADVAGVLFSKDPTNGSVARMAITANYGLGESVVSATVDPDTIMLNRTWDDQLYITEKTVGKKEMKTIMSDDGGTIETKNEDSEACEFTISDTVALRLGKIAVELEKAFGTARDIEWAVQQDKIFLLQARPVTSDAVLTDFDVLHEFDSTFRTQTEHFSTGNVAEVMPGAASPLSITSNILGHGLTFLTILRAKIDSFRYDPSVIDGAVMYTNHSFFDVVQQQAGNVADKERGTLAKAMEVGLYGKMLDDTEFMQMAKERFEKPDASLKKFMFLLTIPGLISGDKLVTTAEEKYRNFPLPVEGTTMPQEAYDKICAAIMQITDGSKLQLASRSRFVANLLKRVLVDKVHVLVKHLQVTFASMIWNAGILIVLSGGSSDFTTEHYADFAALIGGSIGAESGDVPFSLQEVAASISEEFDAKEFSTMQLQEALDLIQASPSNTAKKFQDFLARHGHRGMKEFDVSSISWGMNPLSVIKMLQSITKNPVPVRKPASTSASDAIKLLTTPLSGVRKRLLAWMLIRSRNAVCYRERAKSMLINFTNCLRLCFHHLAKLMVEHGHLPDAKLMFFMTLGEIGELIKSRSARIIIRSRRRMRQYPYMDSIMYPEFFIGIPKPMNEESEEKISEGTMQVVGVPVCHGRIKGVARVIMTFDEVDTIEPNDILITHATDIGWSPYFPMLSGIATEIGGLVSHGAVVAREYSLPCVIGAVNATKVFKTGDRVLLDATAGTITKLSDDETEKMEQ